MPFCGVVADEFGLPRFEVVLLAGWAFRPARAETINENGFVTIGD